MEDKAKEKNLILRRTGVAFPTGYVELTTQTNCLKAELPYKRFNEKVNYTKLTI